MNRKEKRIEVLALKKAGFCHKDIADKVGVSRQTVYNIIRKFETTKNIEDKPRKGRPKTATSPDKVSAIGKKIARNPVRSMRKLAKEYQISEGSVRNIVHKKMGMKSMTLIARPLLTDQMRLKRLAFALCISDWLKENPDIVIIFSDEKNFLVTEHQNRRNNRIIGRDVKDVEENRIVRTIKHAPGVQVLGFVASNGCVAPPVFIDKANRLTGDQYVKLLRRYLLPWIRTSFRCDQRILFQQDSAPAHTSRAAQSFLERNLGITGFWDKETWPGNSPDLNPLDYAIWNEVDKIARKKPCNSVLELQEKIKKAWKTVLTPQFVKKSCDVFSARISEVIEKDGGDLSK
jgi:transposase